jgi:aryl-alcohol dehydrogenase-like predicted oxidoreductase
MTTDAPTLGAANLGGLAVSRLGLGCMVLSRSYAPVDEAESIATLNEALDRGILLLDTADAYAGGDNEQLVGRVLRSRFGARRPDELVLATKFGLVDAGGRPAVNGRPDHVKAACDRSLRRLQVDHVDLYYQHRVDPAVPIEDTVGAMAELVHAGKVRHLGLCEASAAELAAACAVHPVTALQSEWSLWARQIEADVLPAARRLGVGIVPYSPLGRGFLAGAIRSPGSFSPDDLRAPDPRLQGPNLRHNLDLVDALGRLAAAKAATPAQVALAWLMAQGPDVVPIPGIERRDLLAENLGALAVELNGDDLSALDATFTPGVAWGDPDETLMRKRGATC